MSNTVKIGELRVWEGPHGPNTVIPFRVVSIDNNRVDIEYYINGLSAFTGNWPVDVTERDSRSLTLLERKLNNLDDL